VGFDSRGLELNHGVNTGALTKGSRRDRGVETEKRGGNAVLKKAMTIVHKRNETLQTRKNPRSKGRKVWP